MSQSDIANNIGRSQGSISREIKRNKGLRGYRYQQADTLAQCRHTEKNKAIKLTDDIKHLLDKYISKDWSPEQVTGRLKKDSIIDLHYETIYQYIHDDKRAGGTLYTHLRHQKKSYRKRYGSPRNNSGIPNRTDIDERPEVVNSRERVGDWEADTMIGKNHKGVLVTLDERKTKLRLAFPLQNKKMDAVTTAINFLLTPIKNFVQTITFDNGKEFAQHEKIALAIDCDTYFAKPYSS